MPTELINVDFENATAVNLQLLTGYPDFEQSTEEAYSWIVRTSDDVGNGLGAPFSPVVCHTGQAHDNDQYAEYVITGTPQGGSWGGPAVRCQTLDDATAGGNTSGTSMFVRCRIDGEVRTGFFFRRNADGTQDEVATFSPGSISAGSVIRLEAEGTTYRVYLDDVLQLTHVDSTLTSGYPGMHSWGGGYADSFRSGNMAAASEASTDFSTLKVGSTDASKVYVGSTEVVAIYAGSTRIV